MVGACVTGISTLPATEENAEDADRVAYPTARFGDCAGPIIGEVMSVDLEPHRLDQATVGSYQQDSSTCELSEVNYVGSIGPFDPATITRPGIAWQADVVVDSVSIGPSALQRPAARPGRHVWE